MQKKKKGSVWAKMSTLLFVFYTKDIHSPELLRGMSLHRMYTTALQQEPYGGEGGEMLWRVLSQKWPPTGWNTCAKFLAVHFLTKDSVQEFSSIWTESHDASFCFSIATTLRVQCARWLWPSSPVPPCCHRVWCVTGLLLATHMFLLSARC